MRTRASVGKEVLPSTVLPGPSLALRRAHSPWSLRIASLLVVLGGWEALARLYDSPVAPPFSAVIVSWWDLLLDGDLVDALSVSFLAVAIGFGLALTIGIVAGIALGVFDWLDDLLAPFINAVMAVPSVAYIPIIIIWFGVGFTARTLVIFEFALWVFVINVRTGVRGVDPTLLDMGRAFGLTKLATFWTIVLPAAVPAIFAGLRLGVSRAIKGMVTAELLMAVVGVGGLMKYYGSSFLTAYLLALVITMVTIALLLTGLVQLLDNRINRWQSAK